MGICYSKTNEYDEYKKSKIKDKAKKTILLSPLVVSSNFGRVNRVQNLLYSKTKYNRWEKNLKSY
jgi:hypothetical protein